MTTPRKLTHKTATRIARDVLALLHSGIDPRSVLAEDVIDRHLEDVGLMGWRLEMGTYIDGIDCQFVGPLAKTIRNKAVEKINANH